MELSSFMQALGLEGNILAVTRIHAPEGVERVPGSCALAAFGRAMAGEAVIFTETNMACKGGKVGFGLSDGVPEVPGGFAHFIAQGRGEGFPPGECVKDSPEVAERMLLGQPQAVFGGFDALEVRPYEAGRPADLVSVLANPDQLSALIHIFNFENPAYDNVIMPMTAGCASVVRIPLGELKRGQDARAVVGNVDVFSRPHFPPDTFFFTVPGWAFDRMLRNADRSVLSSSIWKGVRTRLG